VILLRIEADDLLSSIWEAYPKEFMSVLVDVCNHQDFGDDVRVKAFAHLTKLERTPLIREVLVEGASDRNPEIRKRCISALNLCVTFLDSFEKYFR